MSPSLWCVSRAVTECTRPDPAVIAICFIVARDCLLVGGKASVSISRCSSCPFGGQLLCVSAQQGGREHTQEQHAWRKVQALLCLPVQGILWMCFVSLQVTWEFRRARENSFFCHYLITNTVPFDPLPSSKKRKTSSALCYFSKPLQIKTVTWKSSLGFSSYFLPCWAETGILL